MRHHRNDGGYHGETVPVRVVLERCRQLAERGGLRVEELALESGDHLLAFIRPPRPGHFRIYLSAGIHGDEPAGLLAMEALLQNLDWSGGHGLYMCPCLNPAGFALGQRHGAAGLDLNRDYRHLKTAEVRTHVAWLERQPNFDLALCLHEDWESNGFYLYELNPDGRVSIAGRIIEDVRAACPIDEGALIDGRPAAGGIIRPDPDPSARADWPEALYLIAHKTRLSYTFEAPSDYSMPVRVEALLRAVKSAARLNLATEPG